MDMSRIVLTNGSFVSYMMHACWHLANCSNPFRLYGTRTSRAA